MYVECLIFRKLTLNEFKAITNTINSSNGGSQTYIDFPKGSISDEEFKKFFNDGGEPNSNGFEWTFYVNSLSMGRTRQKEILSARRSSSNSLREQNNENRIDIWKSENSGFPQDGYDDKNNPIIVYILRSDNKEFWAGWFYRNQVDDSWPMNKGLSSMLWSDCGFVKFDNPILFDTQIFDWPFLKSSSKSEVGHTIKQLPLQQIYYGAPGTGKSFEINDITKSYSTIRTTFHPDSDYSTFVGAYKPTMEETAVQVVPVVTTNGISLEQNKGTYKEKRITYQYVKQAFLKAYLAAWQKYSKGGEDGVEPQFLIIEEINRGNCAQIFGDLFQLLDRSDDGFSTYPIEADTDLQNEISKAFGEGGEYALANGFDIEGVVPEYDNITNDVKSGKVLLLPNNLYIWATMNTSDQSLFPIDSAFKRRWDWKYVKIADAHKGWRISCGNEYCDWWTFITEINKKIAKETSSDDKKLGYFFCKPKKGETTIDENKFVGKVLFYLWNDVFKDGDTSLFKVSDNDEDEVTFEAFYCDDNTVNIAAIRKFLVAVVKEENIKSNNDAELELDNTADGIDYTKYSFDGEPRLSKKDLGYKIVMKYINEHSDEPFAQLQNELSFDNSVATKYRYRGVLAKTEDIAGSYKPCFGEELTSSDGVKYKVLTWWNKYNVDFIINFAKKQGWSVDKVTE